MGKTFCSLIAISCVLMSVPLARAGAGVQSPGEIDHYYTVGENLCAPDLNAQSDEESTPLALDYQQLERVRIELLERGFNPGFNPERDATNDNQLTEAIAQFQYEYRLPVTGTIDRSTLAGLTIPSRNPV